MASFVVGLLVSLAGLALLYAPGTPLRVAGSLLAAAGVVFVFSSPADPAVSTILLVLVLVLVTALFGSQWLGRSSSQKEGNDTGA
jgi:multisubunit Na+/H+ antiporter MnhG subunit